MFLSCFVAQAQTKNTKSNYSTINGVVTDKGSGTPVDYAVVTLLPVKQYSTTDADGHFSFAKVDPGKYTLSVNFVGMEQIDTTITILSGRVYNMTLEMVQSNFRLNEVIVVAERSKAGESTASKISRQAMDHMQTSSLKDALGLLPGVAFANPNLSESQTISIRTLLGGKNQEMNSLGTAVIVDGSPISNNANLQSLSNTMTGGSWNSYQGGTSPTGGVDIRSISTDNIESIEVIRGIPSAEYGDLTSGAVIVKSKAGSEPLTLRFKTNPNIYQVSLSKGLTLGKKGGNINLSSDYAYNLTSATKSYMYYQRFNVKALWSKTFWGVWSSNISLEANYGKDTRNKNPDDARSSVASQANNLGYRFNANGTININKGWLKSFTYSLSNSYTDKKSFFEQMCSNAVSIYSTNMTDGTTISNIKGGHVFDINGTEITNYNANQQNDWATYMPFSYFSHYDIFGKEINTYIKTSLNFNKNWDKINNRILVGVDFKSDGNLGKGLVFAEGNPPYRSSNASSGYRSRPYYDIPFVNQLGLFIEDGYKQYFGERVFNLTAGARYDWVNGLTALSPRVNASFDVFPKLLTIRAGYGITAKAPVSNYLFPDKSYYDQVNYNGLNDNIDKDKLLLSTTFVFDGSNKDLQIATNRKAELGIDFTIAKRYKLSITAYDELMENGYSFGSNIGSFRYVNWIEYEKASSNPSGLPTLKVLRNRNTFFMVYTPMNSVYSHNQGIEYELDFGRFEAIRTSFYLNGAWMTTSSSNSAYTFDVNARLGSDVGSNVAIYEPMLITPRREQFLSTLRVTHNIPKIGFVITLTTQANWYSKMWTDYKNDEMFIKYISAADGKVYDFNPAWTDLPEFSYMFDQRDPNRKKGEKYFTTVVFNLNLSKEIGDFLTASFFVNNMFNSRPLYESKTSPGSYIELNADAPLFFGFDVKLKIR